MGKQVELANGYTGAISNYEPGLKAWAVQKDGATVHTGYGKNDEHCVELMAAFVGGSEAPAAVVEPVAETAEVPPPADEPVEPAEESASAKKRQGKLPDGFPGKAALDEAGYTTYAKVRKLHDQGKLTEVPGIGEITAGHIGEALSEQ